MDSVLAHSQGARIIVIDNDSDEPAALLLDDYARRHAEIRLIRNSRNLGFIKAVNQGLKASAAPYACILNNDTQAGRGWLSEMIKVAESSGDIGLVNPRLEKFLLPRGGSDYLELDYCRGFCMLIKRQVMEKVGRLEEAYGFGYFDDKDYSTRAIRGGFRCAMAYKSHVYHIKDNSFKQRFTERIRGALYRRNERLYRRKWGKPLRILFVLRNNRAIIAGIYPALLRQHKASIFTSLEHPYFNHSAVKCFSVLPFLVAPLGFLHLWHNMTVKAEKRYDIVLCDDRPLYSALERVDGYKLRMVGSPDDALAAIKEAEEDIKKESAA